MQLIVRQDRKIAGIHLADAVVDRIASFQPTKERPFVLGLPSGSDAEVVYKRLVQRFKAGDISFKHVVAFGMNEYVGLDQDHVRSFHSYLYHHLFNHIDIAPENAFIPDGNASDLDQECQSYERKIRRTGGIELFICVMGADGHVGFNGSGSSFSSRTRARPLTSNAIRANARFFKGDECKIPQKILTVGVQTIMEAQEVAIIATGGQRALALKHTLEGNINHTWTLSALKARRNVKVIADEAATSGLKAKTIASSKEYEVASYEYKTSQNIRPSVIAATEAPLMSPRSPGIPDRILERAPCCLDLAAQEHALAWQTAKHSPAPRMRPPERTRIC